MSHDFWEDMAMAFVAESPIEDELHGRRLEGPEMHSVRDLAEQRQAGTLELPAQAGTRVRFVASLDSVLSYADLPEEGATGTVVSIRTAGGHATDDGVRAYVLFDDSTLRPIIAAHLQVVSGVKVARGFRRTYGTLGDLTAFFSMSAERDDELVHKATKDLWSFHRDGGQYVIERLFDETGKPLKV